MLSVSEIATFVLTFAVMFQLALMAHSTIAIVILVASLPVTIPELARKGLKA